MVHRAATLADLDFVTTAIVEAEKSGTDRTLYERVFALSPAEARELVRAIAREEPGGCELSCDAFLLAVDRERGDAPAAALAAWVEAGGGVPSSFVKASLLARALGEKWREAQPRLRALSAIDLPREPGALQLESTYCAPDYRGKRIIERLIEDAIARCHAEHAKVRKAQILSTIENEASARAFARAGFAIVKRVQSADPALFTLFPGTGRVLWERAI